MLNLVIFSLALQQAAAVINRLTHRDRSQVFDARAEGEETNILCLIALAVEYDKLPKIEIDEYWPCMRVPGGTYCTVASNVYGNLSDPLYYTMVEYSKNVITHYNHTILRRGLCLEKSCHRHLETSSNLTEVIEACLNETLTRDYRLTAKPFEVFCDEYGKEIPWDVSDYVFGVILLVLLGMNILGTLYDFKCCYGRDTFVSRILLCFTVRSSWARLVAPSSSNSMQRRIRVLNCLKSITAFLVIMAHSPLTSMFVSNNHQYIEESYHFLPYHFLYNGTLIVQTFFTIAGMLLAYNFLLSEDKRPPTWQNLPKAALLRWLRLTPVYALVMFYVMTWARHSGNGPFFQTCVMTDAIDCRRDWWLHLLYIHNYKDYSQCMAHSWYLAADFQLTIVGLLVFCLLYSNRHRKIAIGLVTFVGLLTPAVHTYVQNLHAVLIVSPEVAGNLFVHDPTFNNTYKRGHTNLACYGLGMATAYVAYNLKDSELGVQKYKKYRLFYYMLFPLMCMLALLGSVFFIDDIVIPVGVRVVYSSMAKFVFGILIVLFILFTILKVEVVIRGFLHWGGWAIISRLTYLVYLVHIPYLRFATGTSDELVRAGFVYLSQNYFACLTISFLVAVVLFILIEAPLAELVKVIMLPASRPEKTKPDPENFTESKDAIEVKL